MRREEEQRFISPDGRINNDYDLYLTYGEKKKYCGGRFTKKQLIYFSLLTILIIIGILVLLTFLVIIPKFAQSCLDDSSVDMTYLLMTDPTNTTSGLTATLIIHSDAPFTVKIPEATVTLSYKDQKVGTTKTPEFTIDSDKVTVNLDSTLYITDQDAFNQFSIDIVEKSKLTIHMKGTIKMKVDIGLFDYTVDDLDFSQDIDLVGCGGLENITITKFDILTLPSGDLNVTIDAVLWNPSIVEIIPLGVLKFKLYYNNDYFGITTSDYVNFVSGDNFLYLSGILDPSVPPEDLDQLFSTYLIGEDVHLIALGADEEACSIPLYAPSVASLNLSITLLGAESGVIVSGYMASATAEIIAGFRKGIFVDPTVLLLSNTFGSTTTLVALHQDILYQGLKIGQYYSQESSVVPWRNIVLPPYTETLTWALPIEVDTTDNPDAVKQSLIDEITNGTVILGVSGTMTFIMGNYQCTPYYYQAEYPICSEDTAELCGINITSSHPYSSGRVRHQSFSYNLRVSAESLKLPKFKI